MLYLIAASMPNSCTIFVKHFPDIPPPLASNGIHTVSLFLRKMLLDYAWRSCRKCIKVKTGFSHFKNCKE